MRNRNEFMGAALLGAGLVYLLDPDRGARRRALMRNRLVHARHKVGDGLDATAHDLRNRARGTLAELRSRVRPEDVDDVVLHERVRSAIGRAASHPSAITVTVEAGRVTLEGPVLEHELGRLIRAVRRVRGVAEVVNRLTVHQDPEGVPSLQGGRPRESRAELLQDQWAPATRAVIGSLGGTLVARGLRGRGWLDIALATAGAGLLARAITNLPASRLTGVLAGRRAVDVKKVINVAAPNGRVWDLWSDYQNFPRFMAHLKEVRRTGEDRSHWVAAGPAGAGLEWDAVTTAWVPNELIAWKSVEGSTIENAGQVRFRSLSDDVTQIEVRLSYNPPGGAVGHALATLLGADPQRALDEDMVRLKSLLEEGKTTADQGRVHLEEVAAGRSGGSRRAH